MKKTHIHTSIQLLVTALGAFTMHAQNRFMVQAGANVSHYCQTPLMSLDKTYGWGVGGFVGAGYEVNFNQHWSLTPQVELAHINNGAMLSWPKDRPFYRNAEWLDMWTVNVPVLAGFRFNLDKNAGLKFSIGPYALKAFSIRQYGQDGTTKGAPPQRRATAEFNFGLMGEIAVEPGNHFSYLFRTQYPFLTESWTKRTLTLSLGVRYSF